MAEIKIEQKKKIWPWILIGLVVAALLIFFLLFRSNVKVLEVVSEAKSITNTIETDLLGQEINNSTVDVYIDFVENSNKKMGLNHEFTNEALLKLTDATNALAGEVEYEIVADIEKVKEYAKMITDDPFETTHADNIRNAVDILTNVLQNIQTANYPDLVDEVVELRIAAESIKPKVLTLDQKDAVRNYFEKASELLNKMN